MQAIDIKKDWLNDLPTQFQHKGKIEAVISAFSKQISEIYMVFEEIDNLTDVDKSKNLDFVGDIACVTRKDAYEILRKEKGVVLTDEEYRKVIKYSILKNSSECTYEDIMKSIKLLWNTDKIRYVEPEERPCTILITVPEVDVDGMDASTGRALSIKPSGVELLYKLWYHTLLNISSGERFDVSQILFGSKFIDGIGNDVGLSVFAGATNIGETINAEVSIQNNLWFLDGQFYLDGEKMLNAEEHKEVL